ncbi:MAG TPA: hypothetical protein VGT60_07915 [Candidatus Limnocylindria bacterium]|nr:hypothetical protein [Candidatus Limnocylindria bacterium]
MRTTIVTTFVGLFAFAALIACGGTGTGTGVTGASGELSAVSPSASATPAETSAAPTTAAPTTSAPTSAAPSPTDTPAATTAAPTQAQTQAPSTAPTEAPTQAPTQAPTATPTPAPTPSPTPAGTPAPNFPGPVITNASGPVPGGFARFGAKLVDGTSGLPVVGACVYTGPPAGCPPAHYISDSTGFVAMDLPAGSQWQFTVQHPAYKSLIQVPVTGGTTPTLTMTRNP